jgi:hypothetical protein
MAQIGTILGVLLAVAAAVIQFTLLCCNRVKCVGIFAGICASSSAVFLFAAAGAGKDVVADVINAVRDAVSNDYFVAKDGPGCDLAVAAGVIEIVSVRALPLFAVYHCVYT